MSILHKIFFDENRDVQSLILLTVYQGHCRTNLQHKSKSALLRKCCLFF